MGAAGDVKIATENLVYGMIFRISYRLVWRRYVVISYHSSCRPTKKENGYGSTIRILSNYG
ncbi:hypothetical protein CLOSYM_01359 [[Clostridium] symbiosum ATCC 14940]|uniref:Uncharacterized protein n=1 Tax=[Clostridium] symbiosum ATCC 14940 TaxID=411472 RepID=A0ABC9U0J3_CLOSY|nr:hypothetical protein CLOSYM_01359 [[Clostridium] symbiosum ATCC 14940]